MGPAARIFHIFSRSVFIRVTEVGMFNYMYSMHNRKTNFNFQHLFDSEFWLVVFVGLEKATYFGASFANKMGSLPSSSRLWSFLKQSKTTSIEKQGPRRQFIWEIFYLILLSLHFKLFLQYCISSEFYVHLLTLDPEMKHYPVFFFFFAIFAFILYLVLIKRSFAQTSQIKIAIPV